MEKIRENEVLKSVSAVTMKNIDQQARTITFIGTNSTEDRSGDIIETDGWDLKNFMVNPVFLWSHNGRAMPPIGRALEVARTPQGLQFKIEFVGPEILPFADTIFKLYVAGFLKGVSVGFIPTKREILTDPNTGAFKGFRFIEQQLIELSAVSVPDNPEALILEAQEGVLQKEASEFLSKSLYAENAFLSTVQELKKEILRMSTEEKELPGLPDEKPDTPGDVESKDETTDNSIDKRMSNMENDVEQLKAHAEMQKSATEVFQVMKTLLETLNTKAEGKGIPNPFLNILAPGEQPVGAPKDIKALMDAITKATGRVSAWTVSEKKPESE